VKPIGPVFRWWISGHSVKKRKRQRWGPLDVEHGVPSGKHTKNYGKSPFLMGKSTISMAIFNSYVKLPEGTQNKW